MGYGLVAIPRTLWRLADVRGRQRLTCHQAGVQARKALDAHKCVSGIRVLHYHLPNIQVAGSLQARKALDARKCVSATRV